MIEYLEGLLEEKGQEQKVLAWAEEMLKNTTTSPREVLAIQTAIMRARATSGQYDLAISPGHIARDLSKELEAWDYFGTVCLYLGTAYGRLGKYADACHHLQEYLNHLVYFHKAAKYQSNVWLNLGVFFQDLGNVSDASRAYVMAAKTSFMMKSDRYEHGIRQAIIGKLLLSGEFDQVPQLLVACGHYLRHNAGPQTRTSRLYLIESRVRFAWETTRQDRARASAGRGFAEASGDDLSMGKFHMLTAYMAWEAGEGHEALEHAITARYYARRASFSSLEDEATRFLFGTVLTDQNEQRRELDFEGITIKGRLF